MSATDIFIPVNFYHKLCFKSNITRKLFSTIHIKTPICTPTFPCFMESVKLSKTQKPTRIPNISTGPGTTKLKKYLSQRIFLTSMATSVIVTESDDVAMSLKYSQT